MYRFKEFLRIYFTLMGFTAFLLLFQNCAEPLDEHYTGGSATSSSTDSLPADLLGSDTVTNSDNVSMKHLRRFYNNQLDKYMVGNRSFAGNTYIEAQDSYEIFESLKPNTLPLYTCYHEGSNNYSLTADYTDCPAGMPSFAESEPIGYISQDKNITYGHVSALHLCFNENKKDHMVSTSLKECENKGYVFARRLGFVKTLDSNTAIDTGLFDFVVQSNDIEFNNIAYFSILLEGVQVYRCSSGRATRIGLNPNCAVFYGDKINLGFISISKDSAINASHPVYWCTKAFAFGDTQLNTDLITLDRNECLTNGYTAPTAIGYSRPKY